MSIFNDKIIKSVAEAAAKIMAQESSHGTEPKSDKEKSLAALAHPKDKITHKDVLVGRGVLKKEETELTEEPDNEQWTKELKDQEATAAGKKKTAKVAAPATQGVKIMPEETEQLDELKSSTLVRYIGKAQQSARDLAYHGGTAAASGRMSDANHAAQKEIKRGRGTMLATHKLARRAVGEEVEQIEERSLTEPEMEKKEKYVKSMKKGLSGFKERYGDRAKSVMYATATKMAKED